MLPSSVRRHVAPGCASPCPIDRFPETVSSRSRRDLLERDLPRSGVRVRLVMVTAATSGARKGVGGCGRRRARPSNPLCGRSSPRRRAWLKPPRRTLRTAVPARPRASPLRRTAVGGESCGTPASPSEFGSARRSPRRSPRFARARRAGNRSAPCRTDRAAGTAQVLVGSAWRRASARRATQRGEGR